MDTHGRTHARTHARLQAQELKHAHMHSTHTCIHALSPLVKKSQEDEVVAQTHYPMLHRHFHHKGEHVVHEGAEGFVAERAQRQVRHGLQPPQTKHHATYNVHVQL